jgi:phage terminase large subunit-like protein
MTETVFNPSAHPVIGLPGAAELAAMSDEAARQFFIAREEAIALERAEPMQHGWEPPIWLVCDCILGMPWVEEHWKERGWPGTAREFREQLGFEHPIDVLLILGGNRGGKSQYAANRQSRVLQMFEGKRGWAFHSTLEMSRDYQQPLHYLYLPADLKLKDIKSAKTYIAYKEKTGFSDERYILPSRPGVAGSRCAFKSYDQEKEKAIEGGEIDIVWPDELVPADWLKTMELRIATRRGKIITTFTPVQGYSDTVAMFLDGARTVRESVAYLCPKDGGEPEPWHALGLTKEEYDHLLEVERRNEAEKRDEAPLYPQSRPERCELWFSDRINRIEQNLGGGGGAATCGESLVGDSSKQLQSGEARVPVYDHATKAGPLPNSVNSVNSVKEREFERVPRIMKCADPKRAVVFFHASDNPYGNPKGVWQTIRSGTTDFIKERFYGIAKKTVGAVFTVFDWNAHTVRPEDIPAEGTNWHLVDPHGIGRNYAMIWIRSTPEHDYVYREWPGNYYIPEIGVPGAWATAGNAKHPDGLMGPGQRSFGWGHLQYKKEIARVENWPQYAPGAGDEEVKSWDQWLTEVRGERGEVRGKEPVHERQMDSRFASVPKQTQSSSQTPERPVTLLTEMDDIGLTFHPTPGDSVNEGVRDIENALFFRPNEPISFHNKPRLLISRDCLNSIFALQIWTGLEKDKGATAEWIGLLRYFYRGRCGWMGKEEPEEENEGWHEPYETAGRVAGGF